MTVWIYAKTTERAAGVARVLGLNRRDFRAFGNLSNARGIAHNPGDRVIVLHGLSERLDFVARWNAAAAGIQVEYWAEHVEASTGGEP